jgi:hypothetical protein
MNGTVVETLVAASSIGYQVQLRWLKFYNGGNSYLASVDKAQAIPYIPHSCFTYRSTDLAFQPRFSGLTTISTSRVILQRERLTVGGHVRQLHVLCNHVA